jgi:hypothetical protein
VKKSKINIGTNSFLKIQEEISKMVDMTGKLTVVQAEFQADSILAGCIENHTAVLVLLSDSDLAVLLGSKCISFKDFSYNDRYKLKTMKDMEIFWPDLSVIQEIVDHVGIPDKNIVYSKKPLLEGIVDMKVRCLLAVGIGCDVYLSGVPGFTPKYLLEFVQKLKNGKVDVNE